MRNLDENNITDAVIGMHAGADSARLKEILTSLIRHLHDFARETSLTEAEWFEGIKFLTDVGHITTEKRQEFILLSDVLGLSTLVTALNNKKPPGCTEATVFGPFHVEDSPYYKLGDDLANGAPGEPCFVRGRVVGTDGVAIPGAELQVWQADADGMYDVQYHGAPGSKDEHRARGTLHTDALGNFHFKTIRAEAYPIPHDGPVGRMLDALGRHPWRPAHLHFMITAPGYERLITHVFREGDRYLDSDAVFGVRTSLVAEWIRHPPGRTPDGASSDAPFFSVDFDFVLNPMPTQSDDSAMSAQSSPT